MIRGNRGEIEQRALVTIVIIAVFLIIALFVVKMMMDQADVTAKRDTCRKSIQLNGIKLNGLVDEFGNPADIKCSTEYLNFKSQDDTRLKKEIADKMVECWDTYGKGDLELFNTKDNSYCVVCSRLTFDKKTELPEFSNYLNSNLAPLKKRSYMEYLSGVRIENYEKSVYDNTDLNKFDTISTKEPLAVMFVMGKEAFPGGKVEGTKLTTTPEGFAIGSAAGVTTGITLGVLLVAGAISCPVTGGAGCALSVAVIATITGGAAGAGIGYMIGSDRSADWDARIVLWPYDKLDEMQCTYMEGKTGELEIKEVGSG
jgi:hypothetical protein